MGKSVNQLVDISAVITAQGLLRRIFGIGLFMTIDDSVLGVTDSDRLMIAAGMEDIEGVYAEDSEPYKAANIWFQQSPRPKNLIIGRWIKTASKAFLFGTPPAELATIKAIADGSFKMNAEDILLMDFSAVTSFADVAAIIQAKLQAATDPNLVASTVGYDSVNGRFIIDNNVTGSTSSLTLATAAASGTDVSELLGFDDGTIWNGADAESIGDALNTINEVNATWYHLMIDATLDADEDATIEAIRAWIASKINFFWSEKADTGILTSGESTSIFASMFAFQTDRISGDYTESDKRYLAVSSAARMSSWNPAAAFSLINPAYKDRPGILPASLNTTQIAELERKKVNYFTSISTATGDDQDTSYFFGNTFKTGVFQDIRIFVDWFRDAIQVAIYNFLRQSVRVPQTTPGHVSLEESINAVCRQAIFNGGLAPGQLSDAMTADVQNVTGISNFDGFLTNGFLVWFAPLSLQDQTDRAQRKASPFKVWSKGSGAINTASIALSYEA